MRHVLTLFDLTSAEIEEISEITEDLKTKLAQGVREPLFPGRVLALLFEKQSLRTRVSFETAMAHLGGNSLFLGKDVGWGERESAADFGQVLGEYVDAVVCRANSHAKVEALAEHCNRPVINGLTDTSHPCQALADLYTLRELHGSLTGLRLAYVGDANNVARSLAIACGKLGVEFAVAAPDGYQFDTEFLTELEKKLPTMSLVQTTDPHEAVAGAVAVYTDVWASMGQEGEREERARALAGYQVNSGLMKQAASEACFLHCLPARRGEEVTAEVIDGPRSAIVQEAGNRLHAQKGLLAWLLRSTG
ncbi:MAG: ornithine carbamoyltransferase [Planctomycetaceae bacterium]|nr:ornithine carbamoyltransferase [Planctomycetaceae bacterium]